MQSVWTNLAFFDFVLTIWRHQERRKRLSVSSADDSAMVDRMFGYLDTVDTSSNIDGMDSSIPRLEDEDDISEYKFSKYAATYFQVAVCDVIELLVELLFFAVYSRDPSREKRHQNAATCTWEWKW